MTVDDNKTDIEKLLENAEASGIVQLTPSR